MTCHPLGLFPFEPLRQALIRRLPEIDAHQPNGHPRVVPAGDFIRAADVLNVSRRCLQRWANGQLLSARAADQCATRLGQHPTAIWPDFNEILDEVDRQRVERRHARRRALAASGSR